MTQPIAWMVYTQDGQSCYVTDNPADISPDQRALPLYTEPVPTDEALLRQALEALEGLFGVPDAWTGAGGGGVAVWRLGGADSVRAAITALRERLGKGTEQKV